MLRTQTPFETGWIYHRNPRHLPTGKQEVSKFAALSTISLSSFLYGYIAAEEKQGEPLWQWLSYIICTAVCPALSYFNSTSEYITMRLARIIPGELQAFCDTPSWWENFWEIIRTVVISGISSIGLTTTSLRYPKFSSEILQIFYVIFIQLANTAFHALPVELVALKHFIYSLIFKPFFWLYESMVKCLLSPEEYEIRQYVKFAREEADKICVLIGARLDEAFEEIVNDSFDWTWLGNSIGKSFAYVKKPDAPINQMKEADIADILNYLPVRSSPISEQKTTVWSPRMQRLGGFLQTAASSLAYAAGMTLVGLSCNGYMWDTAMTLEEAGMQESAAIGLASPAIYLLGVLLGHIGGVNMQADATRIAKAITGKGAMPVHAKIHTKSFAMASCLNVYTALFSYAAAVRTVKDRLSGTKMENISMFCSKYGIMYLSFSSFGEFYRYYVSQFVRHNPRDEAQSVAEFQEMKNGFKRYIFSMKPQKLAESLAKYLNSEYSEAQVQRMFGMNKEALKKTINFQDRYSQQQVLAQRSLTQKIKDCVPATVWGFGRRESGHDYQVLGGSLTSVVVNA